ncbi:hypothetical protein KI387_003401, partial [Taxus chinensis]
GPASLEKGSREVKISQRPGPNVGQVKATLRPIQSTEMLAGCLIMEEEKETDNT